MLGAGRCPDEWFDISLNVFTKFETEMIDFYHSNKKTQVTERVFKLILIHASVIYQIL